MFPFVLVFLVFCPYSLSITSMTVIQNAQFNPNEASFWLINISSINNEINCACQCWANSICITAMYQGTNRICSLFVAQLWQGQLNLVIITENTTTISFPNKTIAIYNENILTNGDAESGPCAMNSSVTHPTGWFYYGDLTQISYGAEESQTFSTPGPSDRGQCYFNGNYGPSTSMFQIVNLITYASDIDQGYVLFNLSAWLGGYTGQNDSAMVSIQFKNFASETIGNLTIIGPVLDTDRGGITATIFRQQLGSVPVNSRSLVVSVNMTRTAGSWDDGSADNIRVELKHV